MSKCGQLRTVLGQDASLLQESRLVSENIIQ